MTSAPYPLRLPEEIIELVELRRKEKYVDKSTALRQLLYLGAEDYVLELYGQGRLSLGRAAELLGKSVYDIQQLARKRGVKTELNEEIIKTSRRTAKKIR
ncbi:MAG: UPF0175 family protein [Candidatus Altiarchaeota archaeon]